MGVFIETPCMSAEVWQVEFSRVLIWCVGRDLSTGLKAIHSTLLTKRCITTTTTRLRSCRLILTMTDVTAD